MEDWEIKRRAYLEKTLKEKPYCISTEPFVCWTGKQGKIDFEISFEKELRKLADHLKTE